MGDAGLRSWVAKEGQGCEGTLSARLKGKSCAATTAYETKQRNVQWRINRSLDTL